MIESEEEEVEKSKKYIIGLFVFFLIMIIVLFLFNRRSGLMVEESIKGLAFSEGQTINEVMRTAGYHLLEQGEDRFIKFLSREFSNEKVVYLALLKNGELFYADSKFEGYLPIDITSKETLRVIDSPSGKIMEVNTTIHFKNKNYQVKIGYLFDSLSLIRKIRNRNIITMTLIQILISLVIFYLIFRFNSILRKKEIEVQREKDEKERFQELLIVMAGINHEIKNPLNSLYLSFQVLDNFIDKSNEEAVFYSSSLKKEIKRISEILDKYGNINKRITVNQEMIYLDDFFNELGIILNGISPDIELKKNFSVKNIISDPNLLKQMFINLYKNSFEANAGKIEVSISRERGYLKIIFKDDGEGIKEPEKIFIPFYSTKGRNSGLGLVMLKRIVKALDGEIEVESELGKGTKFTIYIKEGKIGKL